MDPINNNNNYLLVKSIQTQETEPPARFRTWSTETHGSDGSRIIGNGEEDINVTELRFALGGLSCMASARRQSPLQGRLGSVSRIDQQVPIDDEETEISSSLSGEGRLRLPTPVAGRAASVREVAIPVFRSNERPTSVPVTISEQMGLHASKKIFESLRTVDARTPNPKKPKMGSTSSVSTSSCDDVFVEDVDNPKKKSKTITVGKK